MSHQSKRENYLGQLLEDNFNASRACRKMTEAFSDASLKYYFQLLASKRSQFAMELGEEIVYFGGKAPFLPSKNFVQWKHSSSEESEDKRKYLKRIYSLHKQSLQKYKIGLSKIYDGSCREILIRHKAFLEQTLFELKALKTLLDFRQEQNFSSGNKIYKES